MMAINPVLRWRFHRIVKKATYFFARKLYREENHHLQNSIMVSGAARSGTTWLANLIASQLPCRLMFEPFHSKKVPAFSRFHYFHYMRPEEPNPELWAYCYSVFAGQTRNAWIDRRVDRIRPEYRIIKEIRANLFLRWIHTRFDQIPLLFIIRHPCAVVSSRLKLGWATDSDILSFLSQPRLIEDFLKDRLELVEKARDPEEKHAIIWCINNLVPLKQFGPNQLAIIFYENLYVQPEVEVQKIFRTIQKEFLPTVFAALRQPSPTSVSDSAVVTGADPVTRWQKELSPHQISKIYDTVAAFGLDHLYGESITPLSTISSNTSTIEDNSPVMANP